MTEIQRGFRGKIEDHFDISKEITVSIAVSGSGSYDSCCFGVDSSDRMSDDSYMVFYNQTASPQREITLSGSGANTSYAVGLSRLPGHIHKLVFTASVDGAGTMGQIQKLAVQISQGSNSLVLNMAGANFQSEKAVIAVEIYKKDFWRIAAVASGFNGGLSALLKHYGGQEITTPPPVPDKQPVSLAKVELRKGQKVSLEKSASTGEILINLNWSQQGRNPVDLDLACMVECTNGNKYLVQALGNHFGESDYEPYVTLDGDDRTGAVTGGENLRVNGKMIREIKRILVFTFIYDGVASWRDADGVVTIKYPGGGDIIVRLDEYSANQTMCAIAEFINVGGTMQVEKLVRFFDGHPQLDKAYGWGFKWVHGSKD